VRQSLGLLEIKGLASAILIADAMAKTAAVKIVGIETCKGGGWQTIKVVGDVAAVQASLSSGSELAKRNNCFVAQKTLSRPDLAVMNIWGTQPVKQKEKTELPVVAEAEVEPVVEVPTVEPEPEPLVEIESVESEMPEELISEAITAPTCNLCGDPLCTRVKGEPHSNCLHHTEVK